MSIAPKEITRSGAHDVKIIWSDGHQSVYPARELRLACSCAACVEEMTGRKILQPDTVPQGVHPLGIQLVGRYGIQINWSDGHSTGIYTFDYLRNLCPCPMCKRQAPA